MKRRSLAIAVGMLAIPAAILWAADSQRTESDSVSAELARLAGTITKMSERMEKLEAEVVELRQRGAPVQYAHPNAPYSNGYTQHVPPRYGSPAPSNGSSPQTVVPSTLPPAPSAVPKNWQRFEFNGQTFYIVPVAELPRDNLPSVPAQPYSPGNK
jgi:hypothetical protein